MPTLLPRFFVLASGLSTALAAAGTTNGMDEQFGTAGIVLLGPTPVSALTIDRIAALAIQDDGKIVIAGRSYDSLDSAYLAAIGRLDADGSWDTSFGDHGLLILPYGGTSAPYGGEFSEVAVLADQSVIAAGGASSGTYNYFEFCTLLAKLDNSGALSATFAPDNSGSFCFDFGSSGTRFSHFEGLSADVSGTFYVTSPSTSLNHGAVAHFDTNGALVPTYGVGGVAALPTGVFASLLQPTYNDILAVGVPGSPSVNSTVEIVRLDANGSLVSSYGSNGMFSFDQLPSPGQVSPKQVALDRNHNLLVADNDYDGSSTPSNMPYRFARLTDSGTLDTTFNTTGQQPGYPGFAWPVVSGSADELLVTVQPLADGHLLAAGNTAYTGPGNVALLRLNHDSSYDPAFGDAAHLGWASISALGTATSITSVHALALDASGHAFAGIDAYDGGSGCAGIMRIVADRLFDGRFEATPGHPICP